MTRRHGCQTGTGKIKKCRPSGGGPACAHRSSYGNGAYAEQCGGSCLGMRADLVTPSVHDLVAAPALLATGELRHYDSPLWRGVKVSAVGTLHLHESTSSDGSVEGRVARRCRCQAYLNSTFGAVSF